MKCNATCSENGCINCCCFYSIFSFGMKPQSGKHKIKFKINQMFCGSWANAIGIIGDSSKNNEKIRNNTIENNCLWDSDLYSYIGWSSSQNGYVNKTYLPNGLYCGYRKSGVENNIFRKNNFIYCSNNENYKENLPLYKNGDIVVLEYDSNLSILHFSKENDNGKLNSCIKNLPKNETFCWFVGHFSGKMCLTVVD